MDWEKLELNAKIINALKKGTHVHSFRHEMKWLIVCDLLSDYFWSANVNSARKILSLPAPDLQRLLHLSDSEVQLVHTAVAAVYRTVPPVTGKHTYFHRNSALL